MTDLKLVENMKRRCGISCQGLVSLFSTIIINSISQSWLLDNLISFLPCIDLAHVSKFGNQ